VSDSLCLAHLSDLHLLELEGCNPLDFLGKRAIGGLNLLTGRRAAYSWAAARALIDDLREQAPDHVVVTGDVSNLALPAEFARVAGLLGELGDRQRLSLVPGNHDAYTFAAARRRHFDRAFAPWLVSDLPAVTAGGDGACYPWVKLLGPIALVGLSSARPSPPFFATGMVGVAQRRRLQELLEHRELAQRFVVVLLHHPLTPCLEHKDHWLRRLQDEAEVQSLLLAAGVQLVLHGHDHLVRDERLPRPGGGPPLRLLGATSSTLVAGLPARRARYALHTLGAEGLRETRWRSYDAASHRWVAVAPLAG